MNQKINIIIFSFFFFITTATSLFAEYVFLKDGSIVKCRIETETKTSITARLPNGKMTTFNPRNVLRILYTELYMGKIFVNKTDGTVIEAYMVDEDQTTYTFRKDLYKPQEFKIRRDEVLFTTRKNPSGLKGTARHDRIEITWNAPYTPVKNYKIYFKSADDYKVYGESAATNAVLKGLKGNTQYSVKVTAIDTDGYESLPTNEIKIKTENTLPNPPTNIKASTKHEKDASKMTAYIKWKGAFDADGSIKGYRLYRKDVKGFTSLGETKKNAYEVKGLDTDKSYRFVLRSVDDKDAESDDSRTFSATMLKGYKIGAEFLYILPLGDFKTLQDSGFGALVNCARMDTFLYDLDIGLSLGYWKYSGGEDVNSSYMIPIMATAQYRYEAFDSFFIAPRAAIGMSYNSISYKWESPSFTGTKEEKSRSGFEPIIMAGLSVRYEFLDFWTVSAGANYGIIYETGGPMSFVTINLSAAMKF
ncbi:MAG: fibronectin type III domain-containing protein [Spirochaetes bacterium]|nr:fibronectin type III domain-containing protein [Spirochaetota bacterium]